MMYEKTLWRDLFVRYTFQFEGRQAILVFPHDKNRTNQWLLKTEYFEAFQDLEYAMVCEGYHLAFLANSSRWVGKDDLDVKFRFRGFLMSEFGLCEKGIFVGMSCGGLHAVKQAARYPEMAGALYVDAPVVNLLSVPFGLGIGTSLDEATRQEALTALGLTLSDMLAYRDHPLDHIPTLLKNRLPLLLIHGGEDTSVPFAENGRLLRDAYANTDIPFLEIYKPACGHHPHGPDTHDAMRRAVDFLRQAEP